MRVHPADHTPRQYVPNEDVGWSFFILVYLMNEDVFWFKFGEFDYVPQHYLFLNELSSVGVQTQFNHRPIEIACGLVEVIRRINLSFWVIERVRGTHTEKTSRLRKPTCQRL